MSAVLEDPTTSAPATVTRRSFEGDDLGEVTLDPIIFSVAVNVPLLHQVVTAQLAARRAGTQSTRTRAEVRGGSAKPYRQKGTGHARQGSIRAPHYSGGGVALGPKPRDYAQRTPRKMIQAALRCALSDRARTNGLRLVDHFGFEGPKTREALALLDRLGCDGTVLVVLSREDEVAARSFANLPHVSTIPLDQLTAYDVLAADVIVFSDATLPGDNVVPEPPARPAPPATATATSAETVTEASAEATDDAPAEVAADEARLVEEAADVVDAEDADADEDLDDVDDADADEDLDEDDEDELEEDEEDELEEDDEDDDEEDEEE